MGFAVPRNRSCALRVVARHFSAAFLGHDSENAVHHLVDRQLGRVDDEGVGRDGERRGGTRRIAPIALGERRRHIRQLPAARGVRRVRRAAPRALVR